MSAVDMFDHMVDIFENMRVPQHSLQLQIREPMAIDNLSGDKKWCKHFLIMGLGIKLEYLLSSSLHDDGQCECMHTPSPIHRLIVKTPSQSHILHSPKDISCLDSDCGSGERLF